MSGQFDGTSDAELNDIIFAEENSDIGVIDDESSVSPIIEDSNEQPTEDDVVTDVDQSTEEEEDSEEDSTVEDQTDDSSEETTEDADEADTVDTDEDEDKDTDTDDKQSEVTTKFQPLKANGKEIPIDSIDELYKLASAGAGVQQKFQAIAKHTKSIMAADRAGVDLDEAVNFMANYKENPQDAIARLLKANDIDPLDYDSDAKIADAKDYSVTDFEVKYDEVVGEIGDSPLFPKVQDVLLNQWDETSRKVFLDDPGMIRNLHEEMSPIPGQDKSMFDLVSPIAEKMKLSGDTRSDYDVYMDARGKKVTELEAFDKAKKEIVTPKKSSNKNKKKASSPTGGNKAGVQALDFASMSDADLDAILAKAE